MIVAGTNEPSNSETLAEHFAEGAKNASAEVTTLRLNDLKDEHYTLEYYNANHKGSEASQAVQKLVESSDGVVIATPIWNFSVPAHLKNMIDCMGAYGLDHKTHSLGTFKGKPFFLLYTGGTPMSAWPLMKRTTSHMPVSITYFGGSVIGTHFEPKATLGRGVFGLVVDKRHASTEAMKKKGASFAHVVAKFKNTGSLPLKHRFIRLFVKRAQKIKKALGL